MDSGGYFGMPLLIKKRDNLHGYEIHGYERILLCRNGWRNAFFVIHEKDREGELKKIPIVTHKT